MASEKAKSLKKELMELPEEYFEPLTFGEISMGQQFISLPSPGDNDGHGGLKIAHRLFKKTSPDQAENAKTLVVSYIPTEMYVILIE